MWHPWDWVTAAWLGAVSLSWSVPMLFSDFLLGCQLLLHNYFWRIILRILREEVIRCVHLHEPLFLHDQPYDKAVATVCLIASFLVASMGAPEPTSVQSHRCSVWQPSKSYLFHLCLCTQENWDRKVKCSLANGRVGTPGCLKPEPRILITSPLLI